jgi:hypothetical protein
MVKVKVCRDASCKRHYGISRDKWHYHFKYCPYCGNTLKIHETGSITIKLNK